MGTTIRTFTATAMLAAAVILPGPAPASAAADVHRGDCGPYGCPVAVLLRQVAPLRSCLELKGDASIIAAVITAAIINKRRGGPGEDAQ
ncbi:hypothetical protein E5082_30890 [Streptomyces griseoluteus]|uniref:Uncharacterized protein n=1 Tax=Streptomyces griseoluteus TaxID=29306 RepID=A0A4Z1CY95_STRGP|nr:hypothetical protein [Streptomyces griseoluteus]TGN74266.1 hypothetical protein E5082_30890 [Streptomyces griseoluteus]GHF33767.1 hypothetical protein GCM10017776_60360 [Streptomyces griseoluteus]